jgi:hypothetical protein
MGDIAVLKVLLLTMGTGQAIIWSYGSLTGIRIPR